SGGGVVGEGDVDGQGGGGELRPGRLDGVERLGQLVVQEALDVARQGLERRGDREAAVVHHAVAVVVHRRPGGLGALVAHLGRGRGGAAAVGLGWAPVVDEAVVVVVVRTGARA